MERTITAVYEHGLLRPIQSLDLPENETVQVKIRWRKKPARQKWDQSEYTRALRVLYNSGLVQVKPAERQTGRRISEKRRRELARALSVGKPLSEIVIEERD
jgi:predicted DNA-binding antitoxin AbrB/MazE fold protein